MVDQDRLLFPIYISARTTPTFDVFDVKKVPIRPKSPDLAYVRDQRPPVIKNNLDICF